MALGKSTQEFINASIFEVTVETNGYQGGDAGHGGYSEIENFYESIKYIKEYLDKKLEKDM